MSKSPAFQFYAKDWLADPNVVVMSPAQRGGYIQILALMWNTEDCSLPNDEGWLSLACGLVQPDLGLVLKCFYVQDGKLRHKRLDEERKKQEEWYFKSLKGGLESAKRRTGKQKKKVEGWLPNGSKGGSQMVGRVVGEWLEPNGNTPSASPSSNNNPLPPKGGELEKKLLKWFFEMDDVDNPKGMVKFYFQKYPEKIIRRAFENSTCTSRGAFNKLLEHYLHPKKK